MTPVQSVYLRKPKMFYVAKDGAHNAQAALLLQKNDDTRDRVWAQLEVRRTDEMRVVKNGQANADPGDAKRCHDADGAGMQSMP